MRHIGVFGGTFDPIHHGHLIAAEECWAQLGLDRVIFVPAGQPPHKLSRPITAAEHRLAMVRGAIAGNPAFEASRIEVDRSGPSYTVETLEALRESLGSAVDLCLIMGADSLLDLPSWRKPWRIVELATIAAVTRPGFLPRLEPLEAALPGVSPRVRIVEIPEIGIAASDLRRRVLEGRPITYQVPTCVEEYIRTHCLYREPAATIARS